ncbi:MAG TPA: type I-D CRISPR-associated helicase Cas3' [Ktedonobacterales bacterium]|jgi:CRISPR-associated endonuclease/helicase Cas3
MKIRLQAHEEKLAPPHPLFKRRDGRPLLYHQIRTPEALQTRDLVMNTYNTGAGKTIAGLMYLLDPAMQHNKNVLVIAPTNALLEQHANDISDFVQNEGLRYQVQTVTAATLNQLKPGYHLRKGELLYRLIENPREFSADTADQSKKPLIMVVNPDIFHYALLYQYRPVDQRNVFAAIVTAFTYIIIDEFHYYDSRQLVSFLFFFLLSKKWGYFERAGRKICLLSATPTDELRQYLDNLFGERWTQIAPENEPPESEDYQRIPALAPLEVEILSDALPEWIRQHSTQLADWKARGLDTAIISSSLRKINEVYSHLQRQGLEAGRITGPEPEEKRLAAIKNPFILATPTVDIGYNFDRPEKTPRRQPIDVILFDARFHDEAIQRLGRAGRVLGRDVTDYPGQAIAFLPEEAARALQQHDGQEMSRPDFSALLRALPELPAKHRLFRYISVYGMIETFFPIALHTRREQADGREEQLESLFKEMRSALAPHSKRKLPGLRYGFEVFRDNEQFVQERQRNQRWLPPSDYTLRKHLQRFSEWFDQTGEVSESRSFEQEIAFLKRRPSLAERRLSRFIHEQYYLTKALFSFRDAFSGPAANVYDPERLLSSEPINSYDLFHILENYHYDVRSADQFRQLAEGYPERQHLLDSDAAVSLVLRGRREEKLYLTLALDFEDEEQVFEKLYTCRPVACAGFTLQTVRSGKESIPMPLPQELAEAIKSEYLPFLAVRDSASHRLILVMRQAPFYSRKLQVTCRGKTVDYQAIFGSAAFHIDAQYGWSLRSRQRDEDERQTAIII